MTKPKKGVKYIDEIIKNTARELGRSEDEVREVWRLHIEYVKKLMDKEDVYIIELPKIGNLHYSTFSQTNLAAKAKSDKYGELNKKTEKLHITIREHQSRGIKTKYTYPQVKRSNFYNLYKSIQRNIFNKDKKYAPFKDAVVCIEEYSNILYKKRNE